MSIKLIGRTATIHFAPSVSFKLTDEEATALMEMSLTHYDSTCRQAGQQGGVVYGFMNATAHDSECTATFRQLDLCMKILEMHSYQSDPEIREPAERLSFAFGVMLRAMNAQTVEPVLIEDEEA